MMTPASSAKENRLLTDWTLSAAMPKLKPQPQVFSQTLKRTLASCAHVFF
jgi:hypothetical protein